MIIKHGLVMDPASGLSEHMDILVKDGKIVKIAPEITDNTEEILEARGLIVGPGLLDTHVHFRDPGFTYKEDIHTGALASAKGGFTTVICMANTSPTVDNVDTLKDNLERGAKEDIRIFQAAAISHSLKGQEEVDMTALKDAGACGFTDDGIPLLNAEFCYKAMESAEALNVPIKKILHLSVIAVSTMVKCLKNLASMVLLRLQKNHWLPETVFWHFVPAQML